MDTVADRPSRCLRVGWLGAVLLPFSLFDTPPAGRGPMAINLPLTIAIEDGGTEVPTTP